ncbi:MAG: phosphate acyltransferase PlsX [Bacillota bacterium]
MSEKVIVVLDGMGGDFAPVETVKGAVEAVKELNVRIRLVGQEDVLKKELENYTYPAEDIEIVPATEIIGTDEVPTTAIRKKKDSSLVVGLKEVKEGRADGFVSAGSTGAILTGALLIIGRIKGIERPVLGTCLPTKGKLTFLVDSGANVDCKPRYLEQFAKMGSLYVEHTMGVANPKVALANIGAEKEKGNALAKEVHELLEEAKDINFIGNIEARDIPYAKADVVVCDGFVGNTILKTCEGMGMMLLSMLKEEIMKGPYKVAALMLKTPLMKLKHHFDSDEIGGAPFLGLNSLVVKAHGSSNAKAIKNAIRQCVIFSDANIVEKMKEQFSEIEES